MSNKGQLPELLFIKPIGGGIQKVKHKHTLFIIEEWDEQGRPLLCRMLHDEHKTIDVEDFSNRGGEFMTGYVQSQMYDNHPEKANKKMETN